MLPVSKNFLKIIQSVADRNGLRAEILKNISIFDMEIKFKDNFSQIISDLIDLSNVDMNLIEKPSQFQKNNKFGSLRWKLKRNISGNFKCLDI